MSGDLLVSPSPKPLHKRASKRMQFLLIVYFAGCSIGEIFDAPIYLMLTAQDACSAVPWRDARFATRVRLEEKPITRNGSHVAPRVGPARGSRAGRRPRRGSWEKR